MFPLDFFVSLGATFLGSAWKEGHAESFQCEHVFIINFNKVTLKLLFMLSLCLYVFPFSLQGMVKIHWTPQNATNETVIKLLVSMNTASQEVCVMCLDYLALIEDVKCFFIVISRKDRKGKDQ